MTFKEFVNKGNLVEIAVAFVMGVAFADVIAALTNRIISPLIGLIFDLESLAGVWTFGAEDPETGLPVGSVGAFIEAFINFLIGGGKYPGKTCMNLIVDGEIVLSSTGPNKQPGGSEFLNWDNWVVTQYKGKKAAIEIVANFLALLRTQPVPLVRHDDQRPAPFEY